MCRSAVIALFGRTPREGTAGHVATRRGLDRIMRPGGRRADLCGGSRAAGRRPGAGAGPDRGETRRGGSMGRTPLPCRGSPGDRRRHVAPKPGSRPLPETARRSRRFGRQREERRGHHAARLRVRRVPEGTADCPSQLSYPTPAPRRGARPIIVARRRRAVEIRRGRPARDDASSPLDCTSRTRRAGSGGLARIPDRERVEAAEDATIGAAAPRPRGNVDMTAPQTALRSLRSFGAARGHREGCPEALNTERAPSPEVCSFRLLGMCSFQLPLTTAHRHTGMIEWLLSRKSRNWLDEFPAWVHPWGKRRRLERKIQ